MAIGTTEIVISKANAVRFSHVDGNMPSFDNRLTFDEKFFNRANPKFDQIWFQNDIILVQLKAGLTATVVLNKIVDGGSTSAITATGTTTYSAFKIYDYVITLSSVERFYFSASSEASEHTSECQNVIAVSDENTNTEYLKCEWTNADAVSDTFQFDYSTTAALANVNYMRIRGQMLTYKPGGESTIYDNQNEVSKIKGNYYRDLVLDTEPIPRQIAEILIIAMQHDTFTVNDVGYVAQELAEVGALGSSVQLQATLRLVSSLGMNADDIGFDCDSTSCSMIENKVDDAASGANTFSISSGYAVTQIIIKKLTGTPVVKMGNSVGGEQIMSSRTITSTTPPRVININYAPDITGAWTLYYDVSGGTADIFVQTIQFTA